MLQEIPTASKPVIDDDASTVLLRKRKRSDSRPAAIGDPTPFTLAVIKGHHRGEIFRLRVGENIAGRNLHAPISLTDDGVSRRHAMFVVDSHHEISVVDINSTNGTSVNGRRVTFTVIRPGDKINIGLGAVLELRYDNTEEKRTRGPTQSAEPDAPICRVGKGEKQRNCEFTSKMRALELSTQAARPCWGYSAGAFDAYERLLRIRERKLGARHTSVAEVLDVMGKALQDDGQYERALPYYRRAYEVFEAQEPPAHHQAACALVRQAQCGIALDRTHEALSAFERAEQLLVLAKAGDFEISGVRLTIARVLWSLKRDLERGLRYAREAERIFGSGGDAMLRLFKEAGACVNLIEERMARSAAGVPAAPESSTSTGAG